MTRRNEAFEKALEETNEQFGRALKNLAGVLLLVLLGCAPDAKAKVEYKNVIRVGKTLDANVLQVYNEGLRTEIRTDHANIVIEGARSVLLGRESFVRTTEDGTEKQFCVIHLGAEDCYRMY